jgi:hypothetical protein
MHHPYFHIRQVLIVSGKLGLASSPALHLTLLAAAVSLVGSLPQARTRLSKEGTVNAPLALAMFGAGLMASICLAMVIQLGDVLANGKGSL